MGNLLNSIHSPEDVRRLNKQETTALCQEIREFLVENISRTGGHLSSNLGIVELTVALHQCFHAPEDKIVWDVGHQTYVHKILTGRKEGFDSLRKKDGLSGFPRVTESEYDTYSMGHASNSISVAYGLAKARDLKKEDHQVICVIGDGSMTGGMVYEAMNNAGHGKTGMIVILNDNKMSISHSVGALASHLGRLRTRKMYLQGKNKVKDTLTSHPGLKGVYRASHYMKSRIKYLVTEGVLFEEMGFTYLGPVDGHDVEAMKEAMEQAKVLKEPVLIHVITQKGKGYEAAEKHPDTFHGVGRFDPSTGEVFSNCSEETYAEVFGRTLTELGKKDPRITLVTAAMSDGTGVSVCDGMEERVFDVGIAEEHAVTFAGGLAKGGMKPYVAIYSTFMQRAYDQILEDICLQDLGVVLSMDHAGIVGDDGETHQGIFDIPFLSHMPNMTIAAPSCKEELVRVLEQAAEYSHPLAIRYPKGKAISLKQYEALDPAWGKSQILKAFDPSKKEMKVTVLAVGCMVETALGTAELLKNEAVDLQVVDVRFVLPMDEEMLLKVATESEVILTIEDGASVGGYGALVDQWLKKRNLDHVKTEHLALPNAFISQDTRENTLKTYGLDEENLKNVILDQLK